MNGWESSYYSELVRKSEYDFDAQKNTWLSDRDGHDLFARIGEVVSEKLGRSIAL